MKSGTVMNRFQVSCTNCGQVDYPEETLEKALAMAKRVKTSHNTEGEHITVYDRMAHYGRPELWETNGKVIQYRHKLQPEVK